MDSFNYVNVKCKDFPRSVCFVVGCSNMAISAARLKLSEKVDAIIYVCRNCLLEIADDTKATKKKVQ